MILVMPFEQLPYLRLSDSFFGIVPGFTVIKILGAVGLAIVLWNVMTGRAHFRPWDSRAGTAFIVYLALVCFAATIEGATPRAVTRFLSIALFFPIVLLAIRSEHDLRRVLWACPSLMILSLPYAYVQLYRLGGPLGIGHYERNYFAMALVLLIPLAFVIARQQKSTGTRVVSFAGLGWLVASVIWTGSRGGFIGTALAIGLLSFRMARHRLLATVLVEASFLLATLMLPSTTAQRLLATLPLSQFHDTGVRTSTQRRIDLLHSGIRMIGANPILGVGLGKFEEMSSVYYNDARGLTAHNTFLEIGAESGLPALIAFGFFLILLFQSLLRSGRVALTLERPHVYEWTIAIQSGLAGFLLAACFLSAQFEKFFWLLVFITIALERLLVMALNAREKAMTATPVIPEEPIETSA